VISINIKAATSDSVCAGLVVTEIKKINASGTDAFLIPYWTAICKGILDHLKASADIVPGTFEDAENRPIVGIGKLQ